MCEFRLLRDGANPSGGFIFASSDYKALGAFFCNYRRVGSALASAHQDSRQSIDSMSAHQRIT
jgi:hypothetical protein